MKKSFKKMIFLGNSDESERQVKLLHKKLDEVLENLGGLQQLIHADSEENYKRQKEQNEIGKKEIEDNVRQIVMALTGKEIIFKNKRK